MSDATADSPQLPGGCLCRRVRYEARPDHREGYYCHCRMCQLAFGNTRAAFINLRKDELRWTGEPPKFHASSKLAKRGFCPDCGTPLSFEYIDSQYMDIAVGSLDDPSVLTPTTHFSIETRVAAWHCDDGLPGERLDESKKLQQRWRDAYGDGVQPGVEATRTEP